MLHEITFEQFREWRTYANIEPFDETRQDLRTAHIVATLANLFRGKNKPSKPISDYLLRFGPRPQKTWEQLKALGKMAASVFNSSDKDKNKAA